MKYIVVDLEMNPIAREHRAERKICKDEIIEIGAVLLDEAFQEIGNFRTLIKPKYNLRIETKIEELTKITTNRVQGAPKFEEGLSMFLDWCASVPDEIQILQWSESDMGQIRKEMRLKNFMPTLRQSQVLKEWIDFQREWDHAIGTERQISLERAVSDAGLSFEGQMHDALFDARNTGKLLRILRTPELRKEALGRVQLVLEDRNIGVSLGEIFNLKGIQFASA